MIGDYDFTSRTIGSLFGPIDVVTTRQLFF